MKSILTTGEVAKICKVAPRTVSKWIDTGILSGYRLPGSKDRRVESKNLLDFMKRNKMPTDLLEKPHTLVIVDTTDATMVVKNMIDAETDYKAIVVGNVFEAGMAIKEYNPRVILYNIVGFGAEFLKMIPGKETTKILAIGRQFTPAEQAEYQAIGVQCMPHPCTVTQILFELVRA